MDGKTWLLVAMVAMMAAYIMNQPAPAGFQEPLKLKFTIAMMRIANGFLIMAAKAGLCNSRINCTRALYEKIGGSFPLNTTGVKITDDVFNGVPVQLIDPEVRREIEKSPAVIYFHGGGFMLGSKVSMSSPAIEAAKRLQMPVLFVEYRLAPENPYPRPLTDCENATLYFMKNAQKYNIDPARIAVAGDSAGGNLAAALTLKMRTVRSVEKVKIQVLLWPMLQAFDFNLPSHQNDIPGTILSVRQFVEFWLHYMGRDPILWPLILDATHITSDLRKDYGYLIDKRIVPKGIATEQPRRTVSGGNDNLASIMSNYVLHPHVCPLMLKNYHDVPETFIYTLQHDILRDEGIIFAKRLQKSGIKVTHKHFPVGYHGTVGLTDEERDKLFNDTLEFIRTKL